jgi:hypothetical protein
MKLTKSKLKEIIKEELQRLNETQLYKGVFDYDAGDPYKAAHSFRDMFDGADHGYSESSDSYGWNNDKNWQKAVDEHHKEMFKIVDEYIKAQKKADSFYKTQAKIFNKWRKVDGSKAG